MVQCDGTVITAVLASLSKHTPANPKRWYGRTHCRNQLVGSTFVIPRRASSAAAAAVGWSTTGSAWVVARRMIVAVRERSMLVCMFLGVLSLFFWIKSMICATIEGHSGNDGGGATFTTREKPNTAL